MEDSVAITGFWSDVHNLGDIHLRSQGISSCCTASCCETGFPGTATKAGSIGLEQGDNEAEGSGLAGLEDLSVVVIADTG